MLHRFAQKFGSPGEVIIGFGDWIDSRKAKRTGKRSFVKGKSMRELFRKFGYQVFLVDEYRTSKCCSSCTLLGTEGFCSNLKDDKVRDPNWKIKLNRKKKKLQKEVVEYNQKLLLGKDQRNFKYEWEKEKDGLKSKLQEAKVSPWGLVRCATCETYWNRDFNSGINIHSIIEAAIQGRSRPSVLEREKSQTNEFENGMAIKKKRKCTNCGEVGHNSRSCSKKKKEKKMISKILRECSMCHETGHDKRNCPMNRKTVDQQKTKENGTGSTEDCSAKVHIAPLRSVSKKVCM
ncbi:hypothetical protein GEMRC1_004903 [Eukaryota sp. GEM-RC1]